MKTSPATVTTHSGIARVMTSVLASYGLDAGAVFAEAGLSLEQQANADHRVQAQAMQQVWRVAQTLSGDEAFGLRFAEHMHPAALQGLGFAWIASNTLHDAFDRLVRYYRLISTGGQIELQSEGATIKLWYKIPAPKGVAATASLDAALAVFIQLCRLTKGPAFSPSQVSLQRSRVENPDAFTDFFKCPVEFDADENTMLFERAELDAPLPMANPELARINDQVVAAYLKRFDRNNVVGQVRANIIELLPSGAPSQESIAKTLHLSPRSLQRKLSEDKVTYKQILEDVRRELAHQYLKESGRSIGEVTYLLGYSEPGNFARSFKRWTGLSPQAYQEQA